MFLEKVKVRMFRYLNYLTFFRYCIEYHSKSIKFLFKIIQINTFALEWHIVYVKKIMSWNSFHMLKKFWCWYDTIDLSYVIMSWRSFDMLWHDMYSVPLKKLNLLKNYQEQLIPKFTKIALSLNDINNEYNQNKNKDKIQNTFK